MKYIKNVGYGIVTKSVSLQVFMSPKTYMELINEARVYNINAKTDSKLIGAILDKFLNDMPMLQLERNRMKEALTQKNSIIETLQIEIRDLKTKKVKA